MAQLFNPWNSRDNLAAKILSSDVTCGRRPRLRRNRIRINFTNKSTRGKERNNHPIPPWSPPKQEETAHHHRVWGRNRHDHGVPMIVELHNCYLLKSINRRTYFIVKPGIYFSIYRNDAQLWRITYFLDTIQLFITPLICSPEHFGVHRGARGKTIPSLPI